MFWFVVGKLWVAESMSFLKEKFEVQAHELPHCFETSCFEIEKNPSLIFLIQAISSE